MAKARDLLTPAAARADELRGTVTPWRDSKTEWRVENGLAIEALALRMAGLSHLQIAERLSQAGTEITLEQVSVFLHQQLGRAVNRRAEDMREVENLRLDRLQAAVWTEALKGDKEALRLVLDISQARRRMNGLDEPKKIAISANVRVEMQQALEDLRSVVLSEVVRDELTEGDGDDDDDY
jgi:hypothetical protein